MSDKHSSHEPGASPDGQSDAPLVTACRECGGSLTTDSARGETYCCCCGWVASSDQYDYEHPSDHAYDPANGSNPGRARLETGRPEFDSVDVNGIALNRGSRMRYARLGRSQQNLDHTKRSEDTNRVVERAMAMVRSKLPYPNEQLVERSRSMLMSALDSSRGNGGILFKPGSKWNAVAATLVCMSQGSSRSALARRVKEHSGECGLSRKQSKALRRRTMEIWNEVSLHVPSYDGYKAKREAPFVVPHNDRRPLTALFGRQIEDWLDRRRSNLRMSGAVVPDVDELDRSISKVLDRPEAAGLSGGELIEPILDAILLVLAVEANPGSAIYRIAEGAKLSSSYRTYTKRVRDLLADGDRA